MIRTRDVLLRRLLRDDPVRSARADEVMAGPSTETPGFLSRVTVVEFDDAESMWRAPTSPMP